MEINRNNIVEIVKKSNANPDKDYGQNFLIEPEYSRQIATLLDIKEEDNVLEVGPGLGSLTHFLIDKGHLTGVDIDSRMIDFLAIIYKDKMDLILNDVRKIDVSKYDLIVGNLPYNITTELVTFLLINAKKCQKMVLMCQLEAFNRFFDVEGKEYGPVSVLIHLLGKINKHFSLKPGCFYPAPKCSSLVFSIDINQDKDKDDAFSAYTLAKSLFLNRRKTIYNNLKNYLKDKDKTEKILNELNINKNKRPEDISPNEFLAIYKKI